MCSVRNRPAWKPVRLLALLMSLPASVERLSPPRTPMVGLGVAIWAVAVWEAAAKARAAAETMTNRLCMRISEEVQSTGQGGGANHRKGGVGVAAADAPNQLTACRR